MRSHDDIDIKSSLPVQHIFLRHAIRFLTVHVSINKFWISSTYARVTIKLGAS